MNFFKSLKRYFINIAHILQWTSIYFNLFECYWVRKKVEHSNTKEHLIASSKLELNACYAHRNL